MEENKTTSFIKVTPNYDFETSELQIETSVKIGEYTEQISNKILSLEEEATVNALISLGWTPRKKDT